MLLIPLATGAVVAAGSSINSLALTLFVTATLALFWLRMPIKAWIGTSPIKVRTRQECGQLSRVAVVLAVVAVIAIAAVFRLG